MGRIIRESADELADNFFTDIAGRRAHCGRNWGVSKAVANVPPLPVM
jgi:hypothetical protein